MEMQVEVTGVANGIKLQPRNQERYEAGGFWRRFAACVVDGIVTGILVFPIAFSCGLLIGALGKNTNSQIALQLLEWICRIFVTYFYFGWFYSNKGATPGKMALGLKVLNEADGTYLTYGRAFWRETIGKFLSAVVFGVGFLVAAFREDRKAWHDSLFGTRVYKVK